jgi:hypothetical protein
MQIGSETPKKMLPTMAATLLHMAPLFRYLETQPLRPKRSPRFPHTQLEVNLEHARTTD